MANRWSMSVYGTKETAEKFQAVTRLLSSDAVQDVLLPGAQMIRDIAKRLCPVGKGIRTGKANRGESRPHLRDVIFASKGKRRAPSGVTGFIASAANGDGGPSVVAGVMGAQAPHAHLVELGHGGPHPAPAHPFLRPAATAARPFVVAMTENGLRRLLESLTK